MRSFVRTTALLTLMLLGIGSGVDAKFRLGSESVRHPRREWFTSPRQLQGRTSCGLRGTGTRSETTTSGTTVTGPNRRTRARAGSDLGTTASGFMSATGKENVGDLSTTITGIGARNGIMVAASAMNVS